MMLPRASSRRRLRSLLYRRPPSSHIVHNKFLIYVGFERDAAGGIDRLLQLD